MGLVSSSAPQPLVGNGCCSGGAVSLRRLRVGPADASAAEVVQTSHLECSLPASSPFPCLQFFHSIYHHLTLNHRWLCLSCLSRCTVSTLRAGLSCFVCCVPLQLSKCPSNDPMNLTEGLLPKVRMPSVTQSLRALWACFHLVSAHLGPQARPL